MIAIKFVCVILLPVLFMLNGALAFRVITDSCADVAIQGASWSAGDQKVSAVLHAQNSVTAIGNYFIRANDPRAPPGSGTNFMTLMTGQNFVNGFNDQNVPPNGYKGVDPFTLTLAYDPSLVPADTRVDLDITIFYNCLVQATGRDTFETTCWQCRAFFTTTTPTCSKQTRDC